MSDPRNLGWGGFWPEQCSPIDQEFMPEINARRRPGHELLDGDVDNLDILQRLVRLVHLDVLDIMDDFQPRHRSPEDGVFLVQPWRCGRCYEPLRPVTIGLTRVRQRDRIRSIIAETWFSTTSASARRSAHTGRASGYPRIHPQNRGPI